MRWSWKIGEFAGIGVYMHATFLLLIGWVALSGWLQGRTAAAALGAVAFILALFLMVVLHEYGHALVARRYGIPTRDITLLPIGGVARLERMPDNPRHELWVALAGPLVNIVIAVLLFVWLAATNGLETLGQVGLTGGGFLQRLLGVNITLALFNLIPAFPMDGGRVVRALLATRLEYTRATQIAASLGQGIALLFGFIGLFSNPLLVFVALFVWMGAAQESSMVQMKSSLDGIPVTRAMLTDFQTISPHEPLARAVDLVLAGSQHDFPVVDDGRVAGVLTRGDLLTALQRRGPAASVNEVMRRDVQVADAFEMLETVSARLQECSCHTLPVLRDGKLVGLVTMENIGEFLMIQGALNRTGSTIGREFMRA